jgi:xanthine dehydrogenase accessory factor
MTPEVLQALSDALARGESVGLVTIVSAKGSTPQRVGAKMVVHADGRTVGTIGGGCYEHDALGKAREALRTRKSQVVRYDLTDDFAAETGLICGGRMEVFIEAIEPPPHLYIAGAGHVGWHLGQLAPQIGFRVRSSRTPSVFRRPTRSWSTRFPSGSSGPRFRRRPTS